MVQLITPQRSGRRWCCVCDCFHRFVNYDVLNVYAYCEGSVWTALRWHWGSCAFASVVWHWATNTQSKGECVRVCIWCAWHLEHENPKGARVSAFSVHALQNRNAVYGILCVPVGCVTLEKYNPGNN